MCNAAVTCEEQSENEICLNISSILSCEDVAESDDESDKWKMQSKVSVLRHDT